MPGAKAISLPPSSTPLYEEIILLTVFSDTGKSLLIVNILLLICQTECYIVAHDNSEVLSGFNHMIVVAACMSRKCMSHY